MKTIRKWYKLYENDMKMIWKLYENRYLIKISNNGKIYKNNIELFGELFRNVSICY